MKLHPKELACFLTVLEFNPEEFHPVSLRQSMKTFKRLGLLWGELYLPSKTELSQQLILMFYSTITEGPTSVGLAGWWRRWFSVTVSISKLLLRISWILDAHVKILAYLGITLAEAKNSGRKTYPRGNLSKTKPSNPPFQNRSCTIVAVNSR